MPEVYWQHVLRKLLNFLDDEALPVPSPTYDVAIHVFLTSMLTYLQDLIGLEEKRGNRLIICRFWRTAHPELFRGSHIFIESHGMELTLNKPKNRASY